MLSRLHITNFTIVDRSEVIFERGMTVVTGETGAGKSLIFDALNIALGARSETRVIREGAERCDISAEFDITNNDGAKAWLVEQELYEEDGECLVRRTLNQDGRSKAYINGKPATIAQIKTFATLLVVTHGQHAQQQLLKKDRQVLLLDAYAGHNKLLDNVATSFADYQQTKDKLAALTATHQDAAHRELLRYQVTELDELALTVDEIEQCEREQKELASAESRAGQADLVLALLSEDGDGGVIDKLARVKQEAQAIPHSERIKESLNLIEQAYIYCSEAENDIRDYVSSIEINPERLQACEARLQQIYDAARKHQVSAHELPNHHETLKNILADYEQFDENKVALTKALDEKLTTFQAHAKKLHTSRAKAAKQLSKAAADLIKQLGMPGAQFSIAVEDDLNATPRANGFDDVNFLIQTNPGQALQPLSKVVSGGELSRLALAIYVVTAEQTQPPTLLFDEVDVGIGGATAEIVGRLLRDLAKHYQILCVTHLPQVAAQGHRHCRVTKHTTKNSVSSTIEYLDNEARTQELARMLGGVKISSQTLAHAAEMLAGEEG